MKRSTYALALVTVLAGCAGIPSNEVRLTVYSEPLGALVYSDSTLMGRAPVTLSYHAPDGGGQIVTRPLTAVWPSGAQASDSSVMPSPGRAYHFILRRPMGAPNLETDMAFDAQVRQQALAQQEQNRRDQSAAGALVLGSILSGAEASRRRTDSLYRSLHPATPFSCTVRGNTMDCF